MLVDTLLDTGTTGTFFQLDTTQSSNPTSNPVSVQVSNGSTISSTHQGTVSLPHLPPNAINSHLFCDITANLLLVGQLCDLGCTAVFDDKQAVITKDNHVVLQATRSLQDRLWHATVTHQANNTQEVDPVRHIASYVVKHQTVEDRINFLHACAGYPVPSTWCKAIDNGNYATWPNLTSKAVRRYIKPSIPSIKGHLDQERQNKKSTKTTDNNDALLSNAKQEERSHNVFIKDIEITGKIFTDQTGRFPVPSIEGYKYVMILYDYDSNSVRGVPMKSRSKEEMVRAYQDHHAYLVKRGLRPKLQRLDNKASSLLQDFMAEEDIDHQFTLAASHQRNAAERAIRTWKNHFIAILAGTDPNFPLQLWAKLLLQTNLTMYLLRNSWINPRLSAYAQLEGQHDFNRTPLGPLGTKVIVHEMPHKRGSWTPHGLEAWYIKPAMHHYRCYEVYIPKTRATRVSNTLVWLPHHVALPKLSSADLAL